MLEHYDCLGLRNCVLFISSKRHQGVLRRRVTPISTEELVRPAHATHSQECLWSTEVRSLACALADETDAGEDELAAPFPAPPSHDILATTSYYTPPPERRVRWALTLNVTLLRVTSGRRGASVSGKDAMEFTEADLSSPRIVLRRGSSP
ncbi:hypothetical protein C0Q70_00720 [Pomacea canaliculata]|uniref:Uncharacterized protein n=1 Tax=Pomacea canaliculata TaxID=400727 RepID=A0A2T7PXH4_POMCA|nr:hypothetical protein C0Q70_00720 [Pomacea canaliculata]